jgi:hypothetical protein
MNDDDYPLEPPRTYEDYFFYYCANLVESPASIGILIFTIFHYWMLIDSLRRREWVWSLFLLFPFAYINTALYYFYVYRNAGPSASITWPGAGDRKRIKQLEADIHNLDKAHHYEQLGTIYLKQGKLPLAEKNFRCAIERDSEEIDAVARLGVTLALQKKPAEALPYLKQAVERNPKHDYGDTVMSYAEVMTTLGDPGALDAWKLALTCCSLPRAKVQYAELLVKLGQTQEAGKIVKAVVDDAPYTPAFQAKKDAPWVKRAKALQRSMLVANKA